MSHRKLHLFILSGLILAGGAFSLNKAYADTRIEVGHNGWGSVNRVTLGVSRSVNVTQSNNANVSNSVNVSSNTGGNYASGNTNGSVSIVTGASNVLVSIGNFVNRNIISLSF